MRSIIHQAASRSPIIIQPEYTSTKSPTKKQKTYLDHRPYKTFIVKVTLSAWLRVGVGGGGGGGDAKAKSAVGSDKLSSNENKL